MLGLQVFSFLPDPTPARFMHPRPALNYYIAQCGRGDIELLILLNTTRELGKQVCIPIQLMLFWGHPRAFCYTEYCIDRYSAN